MPFVFAETAFTDGEVWENCLLQIEGRAIRSISFPSERSGIPEGTAVYDCLAPGFIDIQINGGEQYHFTESPTREALLDISSASRRSGTPYLLPTCITSSPENIKKAIAATGAFMKEFPDSGVLGMHLEGPFISPKKRGAHLEKFIVGPESELLGILSREGNKVVKLITFAPERFTASQLEQLKQTGIILSTGHSNATYVEAMEAFESGVNVCTHLYNAMSPFGHRTPGLVGAIFDSPHVYAPIILDGIHCDYAAARTAYRQKADKLFLISDALFLGKKKKEFKWEEFDAKLLDDRYVNSEGNLAGGAITLPEAVVNAVQQVGIDLAEAIEMVTARPARVLNLQGRIGRLAPEYPAVFTVFSKDLSNFNTVTF